MKARINWYHDFVYKDKNEYIAVVWLVGWLVGLLGFFIPIKFFFNSDVTITGEGLQMLRCNRPSLIIEQCLWHVISVYMIISEDPFTYICCLVFANAVVTNCFNDWSLSRQGIKPWPPAFEENVTAALETVYIIFLPKNICTTIKCVVTTNQKLPQNVS